MRDEGAGKIVPKEMEWEVGSWKFGKDLEFDLIWGRGRKAQTK